MFALVKFLEEFDNNRLYVVSVNSILDFRPQHTEDFDNRTNYSVFGVDEANNENTRAYEAQVLLLAESREELEHKKSNKRVPMPKIRMEEHSDDDKRAKKQDKQVSQKRKFMQVNARSASYSRILEKHVQDAKKKAKGEQSSEPNHQSRCHERKQTTLGQRRLRKPNMATAQCSIDVFEQLDDAARVEAYRTAVSEAGALRTEVDQLRRELEGLKIMFSDGHDSAKEIDAPKPPLDPQLQAEALREMHEGRYGGHMGIRRTFEALRSKYYWPKLYTDVKRQKMWKERSLKLEKENEVLLEQVASLQRCLESKIFQVEALHRRNNSMEGEGIHAKLGHVAIGRGKMGELFHFLLKFCDHFWSTYISLTCFTTYFTVLHYRTMPGKDFVHLPDGSFHLAEGIVISANQAAKILNNKKATLVCKDTAQAIWGTDGLLNRSVSGVAAPKLRAAGEFAKPPLTPTKVNVVTGMVEKNI
ncbi:BEN domain-containing protein 5-like [Dermacentor silvarum]|uniref:BEN domain-containing protein 5-like n=1 Tax=Dermacentor silvarum TaxID=543639 RepID=UPI0021015CF4|nr:BEN domain-containing protein 5-like [Dermacentor silvarum]